MKGQGIQAAVIVAGLLPAQFLAQTSSPTSSPILTTTGTSATSTTPTTTTCPTSDDAVDPLSPGERAEAAFDFRVGQAELELEGTSAVCHFRNGDVEADGTPILEGAFHKTLPHDRLGQVDPDAFVALQECILSGDFDTCEAVPVGVPGGQLINPLGPIPIDMAGPSGPAVTAPAPPGFSSPELAGQMAEVYWMALTRDVAFSEYGTDSITVTAAANLAAMPGFPLAEFDVAMGPDGSIDPFSQLFRASFVGVEEGPYISQLMANNFVIDSITVEPLIETLVPGVDFMTDVPNWLNIQNGGAPLEDEVVDPVRRHVRNGRDLSRVADTDTILTEAFRGTFVLFGAGALSTAGFEGPYSPDTRQAGFVTYGPSHVLRLLGTAETAMRSTWYQKWNVHQLLRPEAFGGLIQNIMTEALPDVPIDASILTNTELLDMVFAANEANNAAISTPGTYLVSQAANNGSPSHPSYPSGHAVQNGAFATILKAFVGLDGGMECFPEPVVASADGLELLPYEPAADELCIGPDGEETVGLTFEGEINKLATNVAIGRAVLGVHYRIDSTEGMILGETVAVRLLHQELVELAEPFDFEFRLLRGDVLTLFQDGSFSINGVTCTGPVYSGADECT